MGNAAINKFIEYFLVHIRHKNIGELVKFDRELRLESKRLKEAGNEYERGSVDAFLEVFSRRIMHESWDKCGGLEQADLDIGELALSYGKAYCGQTEPPDILYWSGYGVDRCDKRLLHLYFSSQIVRDLDGTFNKSFTDELIDRGYDISTIKFSIQKKKDSQK